MAMMESTESMSRPGYGRDLFFERRGDGQTLLSRSAQMNRGGMSIIGKFRPRRLKVKEFEERLPPNSPHFYCAIRVAIFYEDDLCLGFQLLLLSTCDESSLILSWGRVM